MTRLALLLVVAAAAGTAVGCGPTQAQSPSAPLAPMAVKAPHGAAASDAGPMRPLPARP